MDKAKHAWFHEGIASSQGGVLYTDIDGKIFRATEVSEKAAGITGGYYLGKIAYDFYGRFRRDEYKMSRWVIPLRCLEKNEETFGWSNCILSTKEKEKEKETPDSEFLEFLEEVDKIASSELESVD